MRGYAPDNNSEAAKQGLNLTVTPIERYCFDGLQKRFLTVFNLPAVWTPSSDKVKTLQRVFPEKVQYPYAFLILQSVAQSADRGSITAQANYGTPVVFSEDGLNFFRASLTPVVATVSVEIITNSYQTVLSLLNTWMFARVGGWLSFEVAYGNTSVGVSAILSESLSIPTRDADPASEDQTYTLTAELSINMFMSYAVLHETKIAKGVALDVAMEVIPGSTLTAVKDSPPGTLSVVGDATAVDSANAKEVFWQFRSRPLQK